MQFLGRVFEILVKSPWESQLPHTVSCFRSEESLEKICRRNVVSQITTHNRRRPELLQGIKTSSVRKQNAALSESPPLSHLLTHAPTHTGNTCLDTAGSTRPRVSCQTLITFCVASHWNTWMKPVPCLHSLADWCKETQRGIWDIYLSSRSQCLIRSEPCR